MAKNEWVLPTVLVGGALAFFLLKDSFKGVSTATQGLGTGISEVAQGISSPWGFLDANLQAKQNEITERSNTVTKIYRDSPTVQTIIEKTIVENEKKDLFDESRKSSKSENIFNKQNFVTQTNQQALLNNYNETVQRKTEYGFGGNNLAAKLFMPTTDVANERKQALQQKIVNTKNDIANTKLKAEQKLKSLFKKKK